MSGPDDTRELLLWMLERHLAGLDLESTADELDLDELDGLVELTLDRGSSRGAA